LMQTELEDSGNFHSTVSNTSRIILGVAGLWLVTGWLEFAGNGVAAAAYQFGGLRIDGTTFVATQGWSQASNSISDHTVSTIIRSTGTTYVELCAFQQSGSPMDVLGGTGMQAVWLGP
jgi:hypothetical protein